MADTKKKELEFNDIYELLSHIQKAIKVKKSKYNKFGEYYYRSLEDILEAAKDLLPDGAFINSTDEVIFIEGRFYVKATVSVHYKKSSVQAVGWAREDVERKKMHPEQLTGCSSSYAKKYAFNSLFSLDDTADADSQEMPEDKSKPQTASKAQPAKSWEQIRANEIAVAIKKHTNPEALEKMWIANDGDLVKISEASERAYSALLDAYNLKLKDLDDIPKNFEKAKQQNLRELKKQEG